MKNSSPVLGHEPLEQRLNVKTFLQRLRSDPLGPFLDALEEPRPLSIFQDELKGYRDAYYFFYVSLKRFLPEMSVSVRWSNGPYWVHKGGGKYTPNERILAKRYNEVAPFLEYDLCNCLLHARILLDRTIALSRQFLKGASLPSFVSFNDHRKFFQRLKEPYGFHEDYAAYFRERTEWFELPLKLVRDKFVVHVGPEHMRTFGYPGRGYEFGLIIVLPDRIKRLAETQVVVLSIPKMAVEIEHFLTWFSSYGLRFVNGKNSTP